MSDQLSFHNPYHFVPVEKPENRDHWLDVEKQFRSRQLNHYGHDCYHPYTYSGRIVCCLTTESPIVIGGEREKPTNDNEPATVKPFELTPGQPAIPATSLRGLLSSLAETASNSALRVLDDKVLSYRKAMNESLSALGMVVISKDEQGKVVYRLKPLALPILQKSHFTERGRREDGYGYTEENPEDSENTKQEKRAYAEMFKGPARLKVYVKGYDDEGNPIDFLPNKQTFSLTNPKFYYARLQGLKFVKKQGVWVITEKAYLQLTHGGHAVGQQIIADTQILSEEKWNDLPGDEKRSYTRGILRVLGKQGRADMPDSKKYEFFIPYPKEAETKWATFPILPEAIERFEQLADERTEADENPPLPYEPLGTQRNEYPNDCPKELKDKLRLKDGDLVYFRPTLNTKDEPVVAEIAFSSIWRGRVESQGKPATVHKFFEQIDPELLPFHQGRNYLSPAELLFGFVQKDNKDEKTSDAGRALAGRVQVSFGKLAQPHPHPYYEGRVLLKSLLSPKLPCPSMYFKPAPHSNPDNYITKPELSPLKHRPQGRKMYLHHPDNEKKEENQKTKITRNDKVRGQWESRDAENRETRKLKSFATPIRKDLQFYFHLDFNNLDDFELGLLFYALRPYDKFRHKLGMGKAIGLGTVQIDPVGLFLIDRNQRYRVDDIFQGQRYHQVWVAENAERGQWPEEIYGREKKAEIKASPPSWTDLREKFIETMIPAIKKAVELLGDPAKVVAVVHTPQICDKAGNPKVNDPEMERESFKWFVANEKESRQMLTPLTEKSDKLPTLKRIEG
jgi:CRISPR-associated protein (TIGR03986 family)